MCKQRSRQLVVSAFVTMLTFMVCISSSHATSITFAGSNGTLSASASFSLTGTTLLVTLTNTSSADVLVPTDVLTGVFFDTTHALAPTSASLNGSSVFYGVTASPGDGYEYKAGVSAQGKNSGISATGLGIFGPNGNFSATPVMLDGLDYGILSAGDDPATGNTGVTGHGPLIKNSVQFTLMADPLFTLGELGTTVVFQYGTATTEPIITADCMDCPDPPARVPAPASLILLGSGVLGLALRRGTQR